MASEMQERVARAIYGAWHGGRRLPWEKLPDTRKAPYLADALTAMEALRDFADEARDEWGFKHGDFEDCLRTEIAEIEAAKQP